MANRKVPSQASSGEETISKTYSTIGNYKISITLDSPWTKQKLEKIVKVPKNTIITNENGTFGPFTIPYTTITGFTQDYINDLDYTTGHTGNTTFRYLAVSSSRLNEKKLYGSNSYSGITTGTDTIENFFFCISTS